jgi:hypothetical protein
MNETTWLNDEVSGPRNQLAWEDAVVDTRDTADVADDAGK